LESLSRETEGNEKAVSNGGVGVSETFG